MVSAICATDELWLHSTITDTYDYDAFGNKINSTGSTPNNYLYRGEQWDSDLGLYYLRARYYNPLTGRFMSRDPEDGKPIDPKSLHKYLYANGDPVNLKDPTGRDADSAEYASLLENESWKSELEMRATAHVVEKVLDCLEVLLEFGWSEWGAYEACLEEVNLP